MGIDVHGDGAVGVAEDLPDRLVVGAEGNQQVAAGWRRPWKHRSGRPAPSHGLAVPRRQVLGFDGLAGRAGGNEIQVLPEGHDQALLQPTLPVAVEGRDGDWGESDGAPASARFRFAFEAEAGDAPNVARDVEHTGLEVDVLPLEAEKLGLTKAGGYGRDVEGLTGGAWAPGAGDEGACIHGRFDGQSDLVLPFTARVSPPGPLRDSRAGAIPPSSPRGTAMSCLDGRGSVLQP